MSPKLNTLTTIGDVIQSIHELPWNASLYAERRDVINLETRCAIIEIDDEDAPDYPVFATAYQLIHVLGLHIVQGIIINIQLQRAGATPELIVAALNYYLDYDAFIVLQ